MVRPAAAGVKRLLQITDTHLLADPAGLQGGVNVEARLRAVLSAMQPWAGNASALMHTGDLVHDESEIAYTRLQQALQSLGLPGLVLPGNHDRRDLLTAGFSQGLISAGRQLDLGQWSVIALDSLVEGEIGGHLADAELDALTAALAQSKAEHILIALHHPPVAVDTPWLDAIALDNPDALAARLGADRRVRGLVFGHVHMPFDSQWNGWRVLATPATAAQFLAGAPTFHRYPGLPGFRWIDLCTHGVIETDVVQVPLD